MNKSAQQMIPAQTQSVTRVWVHVFCATIAGLAVRLLLVLQFPADADDSKTYLELARNWADHHVYGLFLDSKLIPTDLRLPGYPAYLAGVATLLGRSQVAILLSQALLDIFTCYLIAILAAALVPASARRRVAIAGLWLAATCPFVANYSAAILTEVLTTFLASAALVCFAFALRKETTEFSIGTFHFYPKPAWLAVFGAFFTGLASLVRPEMPLLIVVASAVVAFWNWQSNGWGKMLRTGAAMAIAFLLPLVPWATRNFVTLHEFQISAPRYATSADEYAPVGFYSWTGTWMSRYRDVYQTVWKIGLDPIDLNTIPSSAFDSPQEKQEISSLLGQYNRSPDLEISPDLDHQFGDIARDRMRRHPLRTHVWIPFQRALTIWFTPRTELLGLDGKIWPIAQRWENDPVDFSVTAFLGVLGYLYIALAMAGIVVAIRVCRGRAAISPRDPMPQDSINVWGIGLLLVYMIVRTAFLTTVEAPEPRYVVSCYPIVLGFVSLLWVRIH